MERVKERTGITLSGPHDGVAGNILVTVVAKLIAAIVVASQ